VGRVATGLTARFMKCSLMPDVIEAFWRNCFGRLGGGDLVREEVVDECRFGGWSDGALLSTPATWRIRLATA